MKTFQSYSIEKWRNCVTILISMPNYHIISKDTKLEKIIGLPNSFTVFHMIIFISAGSSSDALYFLTAEFLIVIW